MNTPRQNKQLPDPVDWDQMYPGRFLKAGDFNGKNVTLTIARVTLDELEGDKGKQIKGCLWFKETDKQIALNKTNGICIKAMFGRALADWVGKRVTFFPAPYEGDLAIRVAGSPDIQADMEVTIQLPRKRPFNMTLRRFMPKGAAPAPTTTSTPATVISTEEREIAG